MRELEELSAEIGRLRDEVRDLRASGGAGAGGDRSGATTQGEYVTVRSGCWPFVHYRRVWVARKTARAETAAETAPSAAPALLEGLDIPALPPAPAGKTVGCR